MTPKQSDILRELSHITGMAAVKGDMKYLTKRIENMLPYLPEKERDEIKEIAGGLVNFIMKIK
jgi:hypothetical protein